MEKEDRRRYGRCPRGRHELPTSTNQKRRTLEEDEQCLASVSLHDFNQDLLERILSWLPASIFFRLQTVCKTWSTVANSVNFKIACSQISVREPWFLMLGSDSSQSSIVYDTSEGNWKKFNQKHQTTHDVDPKPIPVASSGGLICFRSVSGNLIVSNPVTAAYRELPPLVTADSQNQITLIHAIAMKSTSSKQPSPTYKLVTISGEFPKLTTNIYDSTKDRWDRLRLFRQPTNWRECESESDSTLDDESQETVYFLNKAGDVVSTNVQRSKWKQYSSVITVEDGEEIIHFLSPSGAIVACNLSRRTFYEYPRLLPVYLEHSLDVVECNGEMLVVVLSELYETASLRVWRFSKKTQSWHQVTVMPPAMSHGFYGKRADINCIGFLNTIFICLNSTDMNQCLTCNLVSNDWIVLHDCLVNGKSEEFMSAFSFEPRIEAEV